jgi:hypothetical protein
VPPTVQLGVSSPNTDCLRAHYNDAFQTWAIQVNHLHAVIESSPARDVVHKAEEQAAAAEVAYRESRDRLVEELIAWPGERC